MKRRVLCLAALFAGAVFLALVLFHGCTVPLGPEPEVDEPTLYCGCIQREPTGDVPDDLYARRAVQATEHYEPFSKELTVNGIVLIAGDDVQDAFLGLVAQTIRECLDPAAVPDPELQAQLVTRLYEYRAVIPVPRTEESLEALISQDQEAFDRLRLEHSVCDIIMADVPGGQVMEVVEHVLHIVTDVGLHYQFPGEWGVSQESELWRAMQLAIERGYYDIDGYRDLEGEAPDIVNRILLQEFAYWFITTAWNLQEPYGPQEDEWTIANREELRAKLPEFFAVYEQTVEQVMAPPSMATLAEIGPQRRR